MKALKKLAIVTIGVSLCIALARVSTRALTLRSPNSAVRMIGAKTLQPMSFMWCITPGAHRTAAWNTETTGLRRKAAEAGVGKPARSGRDECDADDASADLVRVLAGVGQHGHAAHRVADEDDRPGRGDSVDNNPQIVTELLEVVGLPGCRGGVAVAAVVVADDPGATVSAQQRVADVSPGLGAQAMSVQEHDCEVRISWAVFANRKCDTVFGRDRGTTFCQGNDCAGDRHRRLRFAGGDLSNCSPHLSPVSGPRVLGSVPQGGAKHHQG